MEKETENSRVHPAVIFGIIAAVACAFIGLAIYARPSTNTSSSDTASSSVITTVYTDTTANVRSCASSDCKIIGTYPPGEEFDLSDTEYSGITDMSQLPAWIYLNFADGSSGYVSSSVLVDTQTNGAPTSAGNSQISTNSQQQPAVTSDASGNLLPSVIADIEPNIVEINCYGSDGSEVSGSGLSFVDKGTGEHSVETNYHVYNEAVVGGVAPTCYATFPESPNFSFNQYYGDYSLTLSAWHWDPSTYEDAAIFVLGAPVASSVALNPIPVISDAYTALGINYKECANPDVAVGDGVTIFGYPTSGNLLGVSETVTEGIVSGILPGPIYKTNAAIDHGNSGGIAILNKNGCNLGIPTLGASGLTAGIGYIQSYALIDTAVN